MKRRMNALALHLSVLDDLLERRLPPSHRQLLVQLREAISGLPGSTQRWVQLFREACLVARETGHEGALLTVDEQRAVAAQGCGLLAVLSLADLIRGVLLMGAAHRLAEPALGTLITSRWTQGGLEERVAVLRWLAHLPAPERWLSLALDCAEHGEAQEFEALACDNPYPAMQFSMKQLIALLQRVMATPLSLRRVEGLSLRLAMEHGASQGAPDRAGGNASGNASSNVSGTIARSSD